MELEIYKRKKQELGISQNEQLPQSYNFHRPTIHQEDYYLAVSRVYKDDKCFVRLAILDRSISVK